MDPILNFDEHIVAESRKSLTGLIVSLLLNRLVPGIILIPLLIYSAINPKGVMTAIGSERPWLIWFYLGLLNVGIIGQAIAVYEFIFVKIVITNVRIIILKGSHEESYKSTEISSCESKRGFFCDELKLVTETSGAHNVELLDSKCIDELEAAMGRLRK